MFLSSSVLTSAVLAWRAAAGPELPPAELPPVNIQTPVAGEVPGVGPIPIPVAPRKVATQPAAPAPATLSAPAALAAPAAPRSYIAAAPAAPAAVDCPIPPTGVLVAPTVSPVDPRFTVRRDFGDGVGYDNGFTYLEGFVPLWQKPGESLSFLNARVVNYDRAEDWETQVGGGYRHILADTVLGINGFYDGRNSNVQYYHQLGFGVEALRELWEFRANFYFPIGDQRGLAGDTGFFNPQFVGTNIALDRSRQFETAMRGFNMEVGRALPSCWDCMRTYAYLGYYHYEAANVPSIDGIRGRLESWVGENVSANFAAQHDQVFGTTITGGVSFHLGGVPTESRSSNALAAKLGNRVVRDPNIVLQRTTENTRELAIDPVTGAPTEVRHVRNTAAAGGDGSVERPFQTLGQLGSPTGSGPNQILFAHAGSVFNNQGIVLKPNQRFLGEGIDHSFTAAQGTFLLPRATAGTAAPIISGTLLGGAPAVGITLANNTEVSGFNIDRNYGAGIASPIGANLSNVLINRNRIVSSAATLIVLPPSSIALGYTGAGSFTIEGNTVNRAVIVSQGIGSNVAGSILGNTVVNTGGVSNSQLQVIATGPGTGRYRVNGNVSTGNAQAILISSNLLGTVTTQFANNRAPVAAPAPFRFTTFFGTIAREYVGNSHPASDLPIPGGSITTVPAGSAGFSPP